MRTIVKRWLLALAVATVIIVAGGVAYWLLNPAPTGSPGSSCLRSLCGVLAFSSPSESTVRGAHVYNFTVQAAGGGLIWSYLNFAIQPNGTTHVFGPSGLGWNLTVFSLYGGVLATFDLGNSTPTWTSGGATPVASGQALCVTSPPDASLSGYTFWILAVDQFQGAVRVPVP